MEVINKSKGNPSTPSTDQLKLIGQGFEGKAYLLPGNKVIKVFYREDSYRAQLETLLKANGSRFFPAVYWYGNESIIMDFVPGTTLTNYLKRNKIDKELSLELVKLFEEFTRLNFTRKDIRLAHIYLQPDKTVKIIDPRESFERIVPYPRKMLKGLREYRALRDFLNNIKAEYPDYYRDWKKRMS